MVFDWDQDKNELLIKDRGISFERIVIAIESGLIMDILQHPNQKKYKNQILILVEIDTYIWVVPAVENKESFYLKTAFPSRKYTDLYLPESRL